MITITPENMEKAQGLLAKAPKQVELAASAAINRTMISVRKQVSVSIRANYIIKAGDIKSALSISRAGGSGLTGEIKAKGPAPLLTAFRVSIYKRTKRGKTKPIKAQVLKSSGAKVVRGAFFNVSKSGYAGLMQRTSSSRYPLRIPHGPSVPQMFGSERVLSELVPMAEETLNKRFLHEVEYRLGQLGE